MARKHEKLQKDFLWDGNVDKTKIHLTQMEEVVKSFQYEDFSCPLCGEQKNIDHLLGNCPILRNLWNRFTSLMGVAWVLHRSVSTIVDSWVISKVCIKFKLA